MYIWHILLFAFLFLAEAAYAQPKNGVHKTYYSNGRMQDSGAYKKKLKQGVWVHYNEYGKLQNAAWFPAERMDAM